MTEQLARALFRAKFPDKIVTKLTERENDFIVASKPKDYTGNRMIADNGYKIDKKTKVISPWSPVMELNFGR